MNPPKPEADKILGEKEVIVVPDVLANSGGVTVSYFEWFQNLENKVWVLEKVRDELREKMQKSFEEVWEISEDKKISLRLAAYVLALNRIAGKISK